MTLYGWMRSPRRTDPEPGRGTEASPYGPVEAGEPAREREREREQEGGKEGGRERERWRKAVSRPQRGGAASGGMELSAL